MGEGYGLRIMPTQRETMEEEWMVEEEELVNSLKCNQVRLPDL